MTPNVRRLVLEDAVAPAARRAEDDLRAALANLCDPDAPSPAGKIPWPKLSGALGGGLFPGLHLVIGDGLSDAWQWALQVASTTAAAGHAVAVQRGATSADEILARALAIAGGVPWSQLCGVAPEAACLLARLAHEHGERIAAWPLQVVPPGDALAERVLARHAGRAPLVVGPLEELALEASPAGGAAAVADLAEAAGACVVAVADVAYFGLDPRAIAVHAVRKSDPRRVVTASPALDGASLACRSIIMLSRERSWPPGKPVRYRAAIAHHRAMPPAWFTLYFDGAAFREAGA